MGNTNYQASFILRDIQYDNYLIVWKENTGLKRLKVVDSSMFFDCESNDIHHIWFKMFDGKIGMYLQSEIWHLYYDNDNNEFHLKQKIDNLNQTRFSIVELEKETSTSDRGHLKCTIGNQPHFLQFSRFETIETSASSGSELELQF